jgi:hypothetical protein
MILMRWAPVPILVAMACSPAVKEPNTVSIVASPSASTPMPESGAAPAPTVHDTAPDAGVDATVGTDDSIDDELSSTALARVLQSHVGAIRHTCWHPDAGAATVSIRTHVTIGADGSVQKTSSTGNDAAVARCIDGLVKGWVFPSSTGSHDIDIPFRFVGP